MDQKYLIEKLKIGEKLAQLNWAEGYSIGCIEEDDYLYVFSFDDNFKLQHVLSDKGEKMVADMTAADLETKEWCILVNFELKHLNKLGFIKNPKKDVYVKNNNSLKVIYKNNHYRIKFNKEPITNIKFLHEFISICKKTNIPLEIDIETDCLKEFNIKK